MGAKMHIVGTQIISMMRMDNLWNCMAIAASSVVHAAASSGVMFQQTEIQPNIDSGNEGAAPVRTGFMNINGKRRRK